jgi:hypothetical protein
MTYGKCNPLIRLGQAEFPKVLISAQAADDGYTVDNYSQMHRSDVTLPKSRQLWRNK